jgi:hypothetical protein
MSHHPGADLLDDLRAFIDRFVVCPNDHALTAVTVWVAHTHLVQHFDSTPRLALLSPEPASGKTRMLEVIELLVPEPMFALNASPATVYRSIEDNRPTLLFDEVDTIFTRKGKDDGAEDLRGLLNAGHRRGALIPRCVGPRHEVHKFPVFAAAALAGLGDLPDTLMTRSVIIRMRRRARHERVASFRRREVQPVADDLRDRLVEWAESVGSEVADAWPTMPAGIEDRPADVWEPLLAVADAAGGTWPDKARAACAAMCAEATTNPASLGIKLLDDLRTVFGDSIALPTATILDKLVKLDESPWDDLRGKPLDARGLANRLRNYGITSIKVKIGGTSSQGYRADALYDAWQRYLPVSSGGAEAEPPEPPEPGSSAALFEVPDRRKVPEPANRSEPNSPHLTRAVPEVPEVPDLRVGETADDARCVLCGLPLDQALLAGGFDTHPACDLEPAQPEAGTP